MQARINTAHQNYATTIFNIKKKRKEKASFYDAPVVGNGSLWWELLEHFFISVTEHKLILAI